jgi:hypothetical protein
MVSAKPSKAGKTAFMIAWDVSCLLTVKPWGSGFVRQALQEAGQRKRRLKRRFGTKPGPAHPKRRRRPINLWRRSHFGLGQGKRMQSLAGKADLV